MLHAEAFRPVVALAPLSGVYPRLPDPFEQTVEW